MAWARCAPLAAALAAALLTAPAAAQTFEESWRRCISVGDADLVIGSCTAVIGSGRETGARLATAFNHRGAAHRRKGEFGRAIQDYDQAIQLDPAQASSFTNRGIAYGRLGQQDRALQDHDQAIRLDPSSAQAYNNRGVIYRRTGQYDRALQDFDHAIRLSPTSQAFVNRCFTHLQAGRRDAAIAECDAALKLNARNPGALYARGIARQRKGDAAGGAADIAAAKAIQANVAEEFAQEGLR